MINNSIDLREKADWVWRETLAIHRRAPETRIASSLSAIEIFVALYYGSVLEFKPVDPRWDQRDRCVISKGHGSICMYPILADLGFFPVEELQRVLQSWRRSLERAFPIPSSRVMKPSTDLSATGLGWRPGWH